MAYMTDEETDDLYEKLTHAIPELGYGKREPCYTEWVTVCQAIVLPHAKETLLGVILLKQMDLKVNVAEQKQDGAHGDKWVRYVR
jgi:hypothetical protein